MDAGAVLVILIILAIAGGLAELFLSSDNDSRY